MTQQEWDEMDPETKKTIAGGIHREIARKMEPRIRENVVFGLRPKKNPDGSVVPGLDPRHIVVMLMHRDEPLVPPQVKAAHPDDDWIVFMNVGSRSIVADALAGFPDDDSGPKIYAPSAAIFRKPVPPDTFTTAVFWGGGHVSAFTTTLGSDQLEAIKAMGPIEAPAAP